MLATAVLLFGCRADTESLLSAGYNAAVTEARDKNYRAAIAALGPPLAALGTSSGGSLGRSARALRAHLLVLLGRFSAAATDWKRLHNAAQHKSALELAALRREVVGMYRQAKCASAIAALEPLLRAGREDETLYLLRGECELVQRDLQAAHVDASLAFSLQPHEPRALLLLARVKYSSAIDLGPTDPAVRCVNRCLRVDPEHSGCVVFSRWLNAIRAGLARAAALEEQGEQQDAIAEYTRCCCGALLRSCAPAILHYCTTALLHYCTTALLHYCTPAFLHSCTPALLHSCTPALLHYCAPALLRF